ncbi:MAG: L,D-transpeptidase family protein [Planctomycetota bacterium]
MSLPSQSSRGGMRGGAVSTRRRRKSPFRSMLPAVVLVAIVAIAWFILRPTEPAGIAAGQGPDRDAVPAAADTGDRSSDPLANAAPPRALPGASEPEPGEVERALGLESERATRDVPVAARDRGAGGVLDRALDRGTGSSTESAGDSVIPATRTGNSDASRVRLQIDTARRLVAENDRVGARALLSRVLRDPGLDDAGARLVRDELGEINEQLVFGRLVEPGDPMVEEYRVVSGDSLSRIASRRELATHWKLIQRVNGLRDPTRIRLGQSLKLVRGPFHAIVDKSDFRLDVWHGPPSDPSRWVYVRSFDVGLGEFGGTPEGTFVVSANKLENPGWVNPRDGRERYEPDDPANPIGEFWLGLQGIGGSEGVTGYGIHGTIDPDSVGQNLSMGCVRLRDADIAVVYELLAERVSRVDIVP